MKLIFSLLAMAVAAAGDDANDANNGAQDDDAYAWSWVRDSTIYRPGFVNPALENPLYHKSAQSVLNNLGNFKALYIEYHNCAWAQYGQPYAEQREGEIGGDDDGGRSFLGCAAGDGGDEYWYMGRTPCFRAQATFSLYGIPKDNSGSSIGSKCHKGTYINSFFTTMGPEALAAPLGVDTTYSNSYCTVYPPSDGGVIYDDDANKEGHHDTKYNFAAYTSSGMGCKRNRFVTDTYGGAFCDGNDYTKTTDTLDSFNKALDKLDCVQIYDSSSGYYYANNDDDGDDGGNVDFTALDNTVEILKYSITCDVSAFPEACPDPHGLKSKYSSKLKSALAKADIWHKSPGEIAMNALSGILFFASLLLGVMIIRKRRRLARMSKAPLPPSTNDPSIVSSSAASSTAPSVQSVQKQEEGAVDQVPEATAFVRVASVVSSVAASVSGVLPDACGGGGGDSVRKQEGGTADPVPEVTAFVRVASIAASVAASVSSVLPDASPEDHDGEVVLHKITLGDAGEETVSQMLKKKKRKTGFFSRFRKQPKASLGALETTGT